MGCGPNLRPKVLSQAMVGGTASAKWQWPKMAHCFLAVRDDRDGMMTFSAVAVAFCARYAAAAPLAGARSMAVRHAKGLLIPGISLLFH
jgi:hypothetical protein